MGDREKETGRRQSGKDGMKGGKKQCERERREKERQDKRQGQREKGTRASTTGEGNNMVAEEKPERRMKQSEPATNAKEEGSTIEETRSAMIRRTRGVHREKGDSSRRRKRCRKR